MSALNSPITDRWYVFPTDFASSRLNLRRVLESLFSGQRIFGHFQCSSPGSATTMAPTPFLSPLTSAILPCLEPDKNCAWDPRLRKIFPAMSALTSQHTLHALLKWRGLPNHALTIDISALHTCKTSPGAMPSKRTPSNCR